LQGVILLQNVFLAEWTFHSFTLHIVLLDKNIIIDFFLAGELAHRLKLLI
jgi:hypothetical protein